MIVNLEFSQGIQKTIIHNFNISAKFFNGQDLEKKIHATFRLIASKLVAEFPFDRTQPISLVIVQSGVPLDKVAPLCNPVIFEPERNRR
ncbi:MAG: hypothetical protein EHM79_00275 [Geobacter sp.]|nr:MAG: hypothetical protein EHM79_00275 [Geobacter sp.]